ncbi:hypothetical protein AAU61_19840 [Desulfocarbo indianensis]|nr:hypothetical protein AAU61_19840 [Desulfocarbo indianensis]
MVVFLKRVSCLLLGALLLVPGLAMADEPSAQALLEELKALKSRVSQLESQLEKARTSAERASHAASEARASSARSLKMSEELAKAKESQPMGGLLSEAGKRINIYGAVELEGSYEKMKPKHGKETTDSRFALATAEIFFDAAINKYTRGVIHLLYEEGDTDPVNVDEAFILIGQTEDLPFYFLGGRMYPAVGLFQTDMVSDPITQNVFETQATAAEIGWAQDWFNFGVGLYNANVHEASDDPDSTINTFYARLQFDAPEGALGEGIGINAGFAYTNNIAGGNLGDEVEGQSLNDLVAGWSAMLNIEYQWLTFNAEYITAADDFKAGELSFISDKKAKPYAYNLELAVSPLEDWRFAARYEGGDDLGDLEPERQYGLTVSWNLLPDTTLSLEYLRGEFNNEDERDLVTTQLAVAF